MKITNIESLRASQITPVAPASPAAPGNGSAAATTGAGAAPAAQVELSAQAQALTAAKAEATRFLPAVEAAPDTRDSLVNELKAKVESGTYHVSGSDIAEQMLRRAKADSIR